MAKVVNTGFDTEFSGPLGKFRDFLRSKGIETNIISGVRDDEDQRQLVANRDATLAGQPLPYPSRGKVYVAAPVGSSAHEYGEAADLQPIAPADPIAAKAFNPAKAAAQMHKLAQQFGLQMPNWGGNDPYHVQLGNWQEAAATQPPMTAWDQTNPANVPTRMAMNVSTGDQPAGGGFAIPPSGTLSPAQIYQLAVKHGFKPGQEAATATAIAQGESSGNVGAFNPKDSHGGSIGLMQINGANAGLIGGDNWKTVGTNPDASMAAAYKLYANRGNFSDWGAYTNGSYKRYLNQANVPGTTLTSVPPGPMDPSAQAHGSTVNPAIPDAPGVTTPQPNLIQKFFTRPEPTKDAQGNDVQGKSPIEKLAGAIPGGKSGGQQQAAAPTPATFAPVQDPMAAMAPAAAQLYSTIQAQAAKPLSWTSRPYGWDAGLQMTAPGMSLNTTGYGNG